MVQIIEKERPDALLPNLGGQSGLNLCAELARTGALEKYGVKVIGVQVDAIERGEDRVAFKETMNRLGIDMPQSDAGVLRWRRPSGLPPNSPTRSSSGRRTRWAARAADWSTTSKNSAWWRAAAWLPAWWDRSWSRNPCSGGRNSNSKWCATRRTR